MTTRTKWIIAAIALALLAYWWFILRQKPETEVPVEDDASKSTPSGGGGGGGGYGGGGYSAPTTNAPDQLSGIIDTAIAQTAPTVSLANNPAPAASQTGVRTTTPVAVKQTPIRTAATAATATTRTTATTSGTKLPVSSTSKIALF